MVKIPARRGNRFALLLAACIALAASGSYAQFTASSDSRSAVAQASQRRISPAASSDGSAPQAKTFIPDWQTKAGGKMEFEVASVKQNKGDNPRMDTNFPLGPGDVYATVGGLFRATDMPAIMYINFAYKVSGNLGQELEKQLPQWVKSDRFDIEAHAAGNPTKDQMRLMMQALLKDRFNFAVHHEMKEVPVFALEIAKPGKLGPGLRPHPADAPCPNQFPTILAGQPPPPVRLSDPGGFPTVCGGILGMRPSSSGRIVAGASNVPIKLFAEFVPDIGQLGRPVLDRTGLAGLYDFKLEWTPETMSSQPSGANVVPDNSGPSFIEALKEQMGLKLEPEKGQVEEIVVDHIDHPTAN